MITSIAITILRILAWAALLLGAVIILILIVNVRQSAEISSILPNISALSTGFFLLAIIIVLFQSLLTWAFLLTVASMAENLIQIRDMTYDTTYGEEI